MAAIAAKISKSALISSSALAFGLLSSPVWSAGLPGYRFDEVVIMGTRLGTLTGESRSASEGTVFADQLENRPVLRTAEVLEVVPGLVVTQHSGDGKANQYFLRGFNLDHGTDFASTVEGMPVNLPTHAHGQGYSDINFLIPELIERIEYKKGTYYADEGNFSAAGAVHITYPHTLDYTLATITAGSNDYSRGLFAASTKFLRGNVLMGLDATYANGPWQLKEHLRKFNGVLKYTQGDDTNGYSLEAMGYSGKWRSTDQIPLRAVTNGQLDRFGNLDPTDGGKTHRYSVSANLWSTLGSGKWTALLYGIDYQLNLYSNFTYATDVLHGDQFEQFDQRHIFGMDTRYAQPLNVFGYSGELSTGIQIRRDNIAPVGLYRTQQRERYALVREDNVKQTSYSAFASERIKWTNWLQTDWGVRVDRFQFNVDSNLADNSGQLSDQIVSPKLTLVLSPSSKTEYFLNWGEGFHSNDARGATIKVDPADGMTPVEAVTPLVRAVGYEAGLRSAIIPRVQLAASLWVLKLDSELLFSGDGGTTEPSRSSKRTGLELSGYYRPLDNLIVDADLAWSRSRFTAYDPVGDRIPNAVERVISLGVTYNHAIGWFGGARLRHLGPAPLIEDNSVRSASTTLVNLDAGYHLNKTTTLSLTLLNAFDKKANDITYYYESQLADETDPVNDIHFHPVEPRELRMTLACKF